MNVSIYTLSDPRTGVVRYVGKTANPQKRLRAHIAKARAGCETHCRRWIATLLESGVRPLMNIVEVTLEELADARESDWISRLKTSCDLTNLTPGGDGRKAGSKLRPETRARMSVARKGRAPSAACMEAARLAKLGRKRPADVVEKIAAARRGTKQSAETIAKRNASLKGRALRPAGWKHSPEARAKIGAASKERRSAALALAARWKSPA